MTLASIADYELFIYTLRATFPSILGSTLSVIRGSPDAGQVVIEQFLNADAPSLP